MVIWSIGLAGSGKSTISNIIYEKFINNKLPTVLLDGDEIRRIFGDDLGYSLDDRLKNASRIRELCKLLDKNRIHVVCAILSISEKDRNWCRKNFSSYKEIFVNTPIELIEERGYRDLYKKYDNGLIENVVGKDIKFDQPSNSDYVINNIKSKKIFIEEGAKIVNSLLVNLK